MNYGKFTFLFFIFAIFFSGCITDELFNSTQQNPVTDYSIFSNLPSEGANGSVLARINESGLNELSSMLGSIMGGRIVRNVKEAQLAAVMYNDGSNAGILQMKTNLSLDDFFGAIYSESQYTNETKSIGGKDVVLIYTQYDAMNESPICAWRDGEWLDILYYQKPWSSISYCDFFSEYTCTNYSLNENSELQLELGQTTGGAITVNSIKCNSGYSYENGSYTKLTNPVTIKSGDTAWVAGGNSGNIVKCNGSSAGHFSGTIFINYTELDTGLNRVTEGSLSATVGGGQEADRCDKIMEKAYDTKNIETMLNESVWMKGQLPESANSFGEAFANIQNQSFYVSMFGDDDADYALLVKRSDGESNLCYNESYGGAGAEIVSRDGKEACFKLYKNGGTLSYSLPVGVPGGMEVLSAERIVGNYSLLLLAYVKGSESNARSNAEDTIFNLNFPGDEVKWTDKMNLKVKAYETPAGSMERIPVADVEIDVYNYSSYGYGQKNEPLRTAYTDDNGVANFQDMNVSTYYIEGKKAGYSLGMSYVYLPSTNVSIMMRPIDPISVTVEEGSYYSGYTPVAGAKVDLYNETGYAYGYDSSYYTLIKTLYTDSNGVADFGKVNIDSGKVVASKAGYYDGTEYVSTYSRNITVYLSNGGNNDNYYDYSGEPFMITVKSYGDSGVSLSNIAGAKVTLYNQTGYEYALVMTNYTDSNGVVRFNGSGIESGEIAVEKEGYRALNEYFYSYDARNMTLYLNSLATETFTKTEMLPSGVRLYPGENKGTVPAENYTIKACPSTVGGDTTLYNTPWLVGWQYRKSHGIINSTGTDVNYTINITVINGTGTDSGNTVYVNNKTRNDFGDIRFMNSSGGMLSYWTASVNNGANATFWVKIDGNLTSTSQMIYIYYGNPNVADASDGSNTFLFFDNFEQDNLNNWVEVTTEPAHVTVGLSTDYVYDGSYSEGVYSVGANIWMKNYTVRPTPSDMKLNLYFRSPPSTYSNRAYFGFNFTLTNGSSRYVQYCTLAECWSGDGRCSVDPWCGTSTSDTLSVQTYALKRNGGPSFRDTGWISVAPNLKADVDGYWGAGTWDAYFKGGNYTINQNTQSAGTSCTYEAIWDRIYIRNYVSSEPSHGEWGSEESCSFQ